MNTARTPELETQAVDLQEAPSNARPEISLTDVFKKMARRKRFIAGVTSLGVAVSAVVAFLIPASYTAETIILPPEKEQSSLQQFLGPFAGLGAMGGASSLGFRNPAELYVGILNSRSIADALIARFHLQQVYERETLVDTRKKLARYVDIVAGRDTLIHIAVEDSDPKRAADMANAFVDELHIQNSTVALSSAAQRRLFFQQHLATEKEALAQAEIAMKKSQELSGLMYPPGQVAALIQSDASVNAGIASREVLLQALRSYATEANPQVLMLQEEIAALRNQQNKLKTGSETGSALQVPSRRLPEAALEQIRRLRDLKYHETLFELLSKQFEAARLDEARQAQVIQVIDRAIPPDKKSWPPRGLLILIGGLIALCGSVLFVLVQNSRVRGGDAVAA
jgi:tyrosine-protein kinase Etk/Wzc